ncbi:MAG: nucleoside-diphosphate-sugar epimerase [Polaribacter sp.]|jgi:nucleoside-diphosphate-sugar epimerase
MRKPSHRKDKILITGASGQIGTVLTDALIQQYGEGNVVTSDINPPTTQKTTFEKLNILDADRLAEIVDHYQITQIYHLVAILSAKGEKNPSFTWQVNMQGLFNVMDLAVEKKLDKVFAPSSIAIFGNTTPKKETPQQTIFNPTTVYGISKLAGELWTNYYHQKFNLDVRSIRYPGIVGHQGVAGGGTTDYAVDIYHAAAKEEAFDCFLSENTRLPMIYMNDAIRATLELMEAPEESISIRESYNLTGMNFTPKEIAASIQQYVPDFKISYSPDERQTIADSWSDSIDDSIAIKDWGWKPKYDLDGMTKDMLFHLNQKYKIKS